MFKDSYDIPGLCVSLLTSPSFCGLKKEKLDVKSLDQALTRGTLTMVDFSNIDGLTIGEVRETLQGLLPDDFLVIAFHTKVRLDDCSTIIHLEPNFFIESRKYNNQTTIDEAVEEEIKTFYNLSSEKLKRMMRCFLQRYQYGTKEKTDAAIQLIKNNN